MEWIIFNIATVCAGTMQRQVFVFLVSVFSFVYRSVIVICMPQGLSICRGPVLITRVLFFNKMNEDVTCFIADVMPQDVFYL